MAVWDNPTQIADLQTSDSLPLMLQSQSLGSKLALLALHFPRLRIIWSRSLHATADIFRALKANQDDPDPDVAAAVGEFSCI